MNHVKNIFPNFYKDFHCIAAECPDSCCKDWDVVIDDETADFYNSAKGEFADIIQSKMIIDNDGDRIFAVEKGKCPFWNRDRLCDIYINLGEKHLCNTCRAFPRLTQDYTVFVEHMLSFSCPEAAKIMLDDSHCFDFIGEFTISGDGLEYDTELMNFLIAARKKSCEYIGNNDFSFAERLKRCLAFNGFVQQLIDNEYFDIKKLNDFKFCYNKLPNNNREFIFKLHSQLDIMNKEWLVNMCNSSRCVLSNTDIVENEFVNMAKYYIYRYYLTAVDSFDVVNTIKRIVCAYIVISSMIVHCDAKHDFEKRVMLMQQYSKEVEHSYENSEILEENFLTNPNFSIENLLYIF